MILSVQKHDHHQLFTIKHLSTSHGSSGTHSIPLLMVVNKIDRICPDAKECTDEDPVGIFVYLL